MGLNSSKGHFPTVGLQSVIKQSFYGHMAVNYRSVAEHGHIHKLRPKGQEVWTDPPDMETQRPDSLHTFAQAGCQQGNHKVGRLASSGWPNPVQHNFRLHTNQ